MVSLRLAATAQEVENTLVSRATPRGQLRVQKLTYTKNPSSPSSLKIFPMELSTPL